MIPEGPFRTISILGVGLMGASLAGALKSLPNPPVVRGSTPDIREGKKALDRGFLDFYSPDNSTAAEGADLVILAAPPSIIPKIWEEIGKDVSTDTLLTDLASVKGPLYSQFQKSHAQSFLRYISSHPMAGREQQGVDGSHPDLFKGKLTFLVPFSEEAHETDRIRLQNFWRQVGSPTQITLSAEEHDRILARISHLPHLIAFALLGTLTQSPKRNALPHWDWPSQKGGALSDILRIAWSTPGLWSDILIQNQSELLSVLNDYEQDLRMLKKILEEKDQDSLTSLLERWQEDGMEDMKHGREG
ncbi:MAG: prephenate dehydrogenase [Leptospirales bacterium]